MIRNRQESGCQDTTPWGILTIPQVRGQSGNSQDFGKLVNPYTRQRTNGNCLKIVRTESGQSQSPDYRGFSGNSQDSSFGANQARGMGITHLTKVYLKVHHGSFWVNAADGSACPAFL
jgi:hypothetical protein